MIRTACQSDFNPTRCEGIAEKLLVNHICLVWELDLALATLW